MRLKIIFRWYDLWIGAYFDRKKRHLYVFPVPMFGVLIRFRFRERCHHCDRPAIMTCVTAEDIENGRIYVNMALCGEHGTIGPNCSDNSAYAPRPTDDQKTADWRRRSWRHHVALPRALQFYFEEA